MFMPYAIEQSGYLPTFVIVIVVTVAKKSTIRVGRFGALDFATSLELLNFHLLEVLFYLCKVLHVL